MTKHLPLLLFIGLALNINNDLFAQNKSKFNKPKMTGKEKAEAKIEKDKRIKKRKERDDYWDRVEKEKKIELEAKEKKLKEKLEKECENNKKYTIGFMTFKDDLYGITEEIVSLFRTNCYNVKVFEVVSWFAENELEDNINEYHIKKAQEELGLDRLIYGYTYIAEKGNDYQNQLEWTTISPLLVTEIEWLDTIIKTIEIKNEIAKQKFSAESSGNYIYCTAFYLDPKTSGKIFIYQNIPIKKIN